MVAELWIVHAAVCESEYNYTNTFSTSETVRRVLRRPEPRPPRAAEHQSRRPPGQFGNRSQAPGACVHGFEVGWAHILIMRRDRPRKRRLPQRTQPRDPLHNGVPCADHHHPLSARAPVFPLRNVLPSTIAPIGASWHLLSGLLYVIAIASEPIHLASSTLPVLVGGASSRKPELLRSSM
jgi:hypothetical protein